MGMGKRRSAFALMAGALTAGCFSVGSADCGVGDSASGLLGNGDFTYECVSKSRDPQCSDASRFPKAIALGARFGLTYQRGYGPQSVVPVSAAAVKGEYSSSWGDLPWPSGEGQRGFVALRPGRIGFIVEGGDEIVDAFRLVVIEPAAIRIRRWTTYRDSTPFSYFIDAEPTIEVYDTMRFDAVALESTDALKPLAGTLDAEWSVEDPTVVRLSRSDDGACDLEVLRHGERTRLIAKFGALTAHVDVITAEATSPGDGSDDVPDAGADDGDGGDLHDGGGDDDGDGGDDDEGGDS